MKIWQAVLMVLGVAICAAGFKSMRAQEAIRYQITQWQLGRLKTDNSGGRIDVMDLEGVCLYITTPVIGGGASYGIAAIAKSQLPKGVGCQ